MIFALNWNLKKSQFSHNLTNQLMPNPAPTSRGIYEMLKSQMSDGILRPGAKLPSSRALASDLGVSRTTVVGVYEQLAAEGYIETAPGTRASVAAGIASASRAATGSSTGGGREPKLSAYGRRAAQLLLPKPAGLAGDGLAIDFLYGALSPDD